MHMWGDEGVDWEGINNAAEFIHDYCVRWARLGGDYKEKYGRCCFYAKFDLSLHSLFYPGYAFYQMPEWLVHFDIYVFSPVCYKLGVSKLWHLWQTFIYKRAYKLAIKKFPHLKEEILSGADYRELLE